MAIRSTYYIPVIHIFFWSILLLTPVIFHSAEDAAHNTSDVPDQFFAISNIYHIGLFYFNAYYLYPRLVYRHKWLPYILCLLILIVAAYFIKAWFFQWWYPSYKFDGRYIFFPNLVFLLASIVYRLVIDKVHSERKEKELKALQSSTELKFLRSQINPHFLFNMLTNMVSLARKKSDLLEPSLIKLSDLMRYMLYESNKEKFFIDQEIGYLKSYIELQQLRFGEDVQVSLNIKNENHHCAIEPMLLIPFVENAFKHGIGAIDHPFISINLCVTGNLLSFNITNKYNLHYESKDSSSGIGLANVETRLNMLYPDKHQLLIKKDHDIYDVQLNITLKC